jgi:hypothetical protein
VAEILKVFELAEHHGVAEVQIGSSGIHAELHPEGLASRARFFEFRAQLGFTDDFGGAFPDVGELFVDGSEVGHAV